MKHTLFLLCISAALAMRAQAAFVCSIDPVASTNLVDDIHIFTATITSNEAPAIGVSVSFLVLSGPNSGATDSTTTDSAGEALFIYFSDGRTGKDTIQVTSTGGTTCTATAVWATFVNERPLAFCQNISVAAGLNCDTAVPASAVDDGSFDPEGEPVSLSLSPAGPFPPGVTPVVLTVEDDFGDQEVCEATITVTDITPPTLACPIQLITNLPVGVTNSLFTFATPAATDNCGVASTACAPASGSEFSLGTHSILCTSIDESGNTNTCTFPVILREEPPEPHDLAIIKLKAPKTVTLSATVTSVTALATVSIANLSTNTETINSYEGLVILVAQSLSAECPDAVVTLHNGAPNKPLPILLAPRKKLNISFDIKFDCVVDPLKGVGHQDYRILATVDAFALGTGGDTNLSNDDCPRPPNPLTGDKGCGGKGGTDVFTDVIVK